MAEFKLRPYKCDGCGHETEIKTNHEGSVLHYCVSCSESDMDTETDAFKIPALDDRTYRKFWHINDWDKEF